MACSFYRSVRIISFLYSDSAQITVANDQTVSVFTNSEALSHAVKYKISGTMHSISHCSIR